MPKNLMMGNKLRGLRKDRGLTQLGLASKLGVSASYLNLIEHNQRNLTVPLLLKISEILNISLQAFSPQQESVQIQELTELLKDPIYQDMAASEGDIGELIASSPALCMALTRTYGAYRKFMEDYQVLNERLAQDPLLSSNIHRLRTLLTSIVSFSEILHDNADLELDERQNFHKIVLDESENLNETVNAMLQIVSSSGLAATVSDITPHEAVTDFLQASDNYFPELEEAAQELRREAGLDSVSVRARLIGHLMDRHGVSVEIAADENQESSASFYDEIKRHLILHISLPAPSINFHLALLIGQLSYEDKLDQLVAVKLLPTPDARVRGKAALANYFAGACMLPYDEFLQAAQDTRYNVELLQYRFSASFEQVCHRLTTLRNPQSSGIPMHLIRVDVAGNISKRFSASGLRIPRYGSACPRWIMHHAFLTPGVICPQLTQMPDGQRYFSIARTTSKPALTYGHPGRHYAISIGCEITFADQMVYSAGLNLDRQELAIPVGVACQLCDRTNCPQRAAPPPPKTNASPPERIRNISPGVGDI
jgi:predicted transcriptional regulator/transcriptional regulator with XRE-family HTH domain